MQRPSESSDWESTKVHGKCGETLGNNTTGGNVSILSTNSKDATSKTYLKVQFYS